MTRVVTLAGYAVIVVAFAAQEVSAKRRHKARLGDVVAVIAGQRVGKVLLLAGWLWLGWHLFARVGD
jgi:hypothetical protein